MADNIEKKLTEAGYRMLGTDKDKEELILSILNSRNLRYLKAIPFLIYNYNIDLEKIYSKTNKKKLLAQIISITRKIFKEEGITKQLPSIDSASDFDYDDFKQEFRMQKIASEKPKLMIEKQKIYAERDLQMWLSQLFTKKEKQIIKSILEEKPVSRTDYEYYSRKTKKKLNSIINLQDFAKTLSSKSPHYEEDLFKLKKLLEDWLEKNGKYKKVSIQRFFISDSMLSIFFQQKTQHYLKEQGFNTQIELRKIKNKESLKLLSIYKEHDFT